MTRAPSPGASGWGRTPPDPFGPARFSVTWRGSWGMTTSIGARSYRLQGRAPRPAPREALDIDELPPLVPGDVIGEGEEVSAAAAYGRTGRVSEEHST
jgi:hypothetical protein